MRQWVFTVRINEGRKFPKEISGVLLSATFAGETKFTSVVKGSTRTKFESTLQLAWEVDSEELRHVGNSGTTACKLTASDVSNGNSLGWVVLDLRTAKLNGARKDAWQGSCCDAVVFVKHMSSKAPATALITQPPHPGRLVGNAQGSGWSSRERGPKQGRTPS